MFVSFVARIIRSKVLRSVSAHNRIVDVKATSIKMHLLGGADSLLQET